MFKSKDEIIKLVIIVVIRFTISLFLVKIPSLPLAAAHVTSCP